MQYFYFGKDLVKLKAKKALECVKISIVTIPIVWAFLWLFMVFG